MAEPFGAKLIPEVGVAVAVDELVRQYEDLNKRSLELRRHL